MEGDDHLMGADGGQAVGMLEAEGAGQMGLAGVADSIVGGGAPPKVIGPQDYGEEMVGVVEGEDGKGVVLGGVGKGDA